MKIIHVVGTDTGVGKTAVACALARGLLGRGVDVGVCKPFASGEPPGHFPLDGAFLAEAAASSDDRALISPVRFLTPCAPWAASREEGRDSGVDRAREAVLILASRHEVLLVEGIGGVAVPLDDGVTYLDFLAQIPGRALVVARAGLGTLNHTLLTLEALRRRSIDTVGVVLNRPSPGTDPSEKSNAGAIEAFGKVSVLADLPHMAKGTLMPELPGAVFSAVDSP